MKVRRFRIFGVTAVLAAVLAACSAADMHKIDEAFGGSALDHFSCMPGDAGKLCREAKGE